MHSLAIFTGSLRKESINKKMAHNLAETGKDLFRSSFVPLEDIPMFNQDLEERLPEPVERLKHSIKEADALLFVTPEYNRSIPAVLKNALDWGSRPPGSNSWKDKPAAVAGISFSAVGTAVAQSHVRSVLPVLGMRLISQPEVYFTAQPDFFDAAGRIANEKSTAYLRRFMEAFAAWVDAQSGRG